jgi:hypothetical protein
MRTIRQILEQVQDLRLRTDDAVPAEVQAIILLLDPQPRTAVSMDGKKKRARSKYNDAKLIGLAKRLILDPKPEHDDMTRDDAVLWIKETAMEGWRGAQERKGKANS